MTPPPAEQTPVIATPGWPPVAIPGRPGWYRHHTDGRPGWYRHHTDGRQVDLATNQPQQ
ncbi:hypothetical protein C9F11_20085 [Streptomyces sp. YIM 121038]|uniref:hypothetical protein n=1 Tax=Streptomyces sp. YIM 121038 TaxID=2136401 RepID=UPI001163A834|nr:hypothetical protein [Streptomyces sp. YIM 121038]QCX77652.1 hypothetical protein C9F11_20085 [Streptomyces sp. YIM 121038]